MASDNTNNSLFIKIINETEYSLKTDDDTSYFSTSDNSLLRIQFYNGAQQHFFNGKLHRVDGPAVVSTYGHESWFLNGVQYSKEEHGKLIDKAKNSGFNIDFYFRHRFDVA